jgi:hypothetical protein
VDHPLAEEYYMPQSTRLLVASQLSKEIVILAEPNLRLDVKMPCHLPVLAGRQFTFFRGILASH